MTIIKRPYDIAMDDVMRNMVRARRAEPTGMPHPVPRTRRGDQWVYQYPWNKMSLGDFFICPLNDRKYSTVQVMVAQQSARMDVEIVVIPWNCGSNKEPVPGFRVTLTCANLRYIKMKAHQFHNISKVRLGLSDLKRVKERKSKARAESRARLLDQSKVLSIVTRKPLPPEQREEAASVQSEEIHNSDAVVNVHSPAYDREAAIRASLARAAEIEGSIEDDEPSIDYDDDDTEFDASPS